MTRPFVFNLLSYKDSFPSPKVDLDVKFMTTDASPYSALVPPCLGFISMTFNSILDIIRIERRTPAVQKGGSFSLETDIILL